MREANRYGVRTTLATDVGAGTSFFYVAYDGRGL